MVAARNGRGWTQVRLAQAVDLEPATLSRLENGKRPFSLAMLRRVAEALSLPMATFVDDVEAPVEAFTLDEELARAVADLDDARRRMVVDLAVSLAALPAG